MKQHPYLLWKREQLSALCTKTRQPQEYLRSLGARECTFYSNYQENLNAYHSLFYRRDLSGGYTCSRSTPRVAAAPAIPTGVVFR